MRAAYYSDAKPQGIGLTFSLMLVKSSYTRGREKERERVQCPKESRHLDRTFECRMWSTLFAFRSTIRHIKKGACVIRTKLQCPTFIIRLSRESRSTVGLQFTQVGLDQRLDIGRSNLLSRSDQSWRETVGHTDRNRRVLVGHSTNGVKYIGTRTPMSAAGGVAAKAGSVHLIYSMDWPKGEARTHPQQHYPVCQGCPFSKKYWLTTKSLLEVHKQMQHSLNKDDTHATPPHNLWVKQHHLPTINDLSHTYRPSSGQDVPAIPTGH